MALKLITPPAIEPVALEDAMNFCRIDSDADVVTLTGMIATARQEAEKITRRQLITATWEMRKDHFPGGNWAVYSGTGNYLGRSHGHLIPGQGYSQTIYLPMPPLQSITSVKYLDQAGTEQNLTETTDYLVDTYSEPARITPAYGQVWPPTLPVVNAVRVVFVCGYGDEDTDVPDAIRNWIKLFIGSLYENRELDIVANVTQAYTHLQFLDGLLDNYRVFGKE